MNDVTVESQMRVQWVETLFNEIKRQCEAGAGTYDVDPDGLVTVEADLDLGGLVDVLAAQSQAEEWLVRVRDIAERLLKQSECLEGYAVSSGYLANPVPSVFHLQAMHFRDLAGELMLAARPAPPATGGEG